MSKPATNAKGLATSSNSQQRVDPDDSPMAIHSMGTRHCKVVIYNYVLMLALFHDKKCCNCFNFVPCILWDFIVLGLVLSW